jgi:hypothetical protein
LGFLKNAQQLNQGEIICGCSLLNPNGKVSPMIRAIIELQPKNLVSIFRGLYVRVASRLGVDLSYVSRVARRERKSVVVEAALERETRKIISQIARKVKVNHNGSRRGSAHHNGAGRDQETRRGVKALRSFQN